jgi:hypothetical protein
LSLFDLLLCFNSSVEYRAISALAENLLLQAPLAALALHPQVTVLLFVDVQLQLPFNIDFFYFAFAAAADYLLVRLQQVSAAETGFLYLSKFKNACSLGSFRRLVNIPRMFA